MIFGAGAVDLCEEERPRAIERPISSQVWPLHAFGIPGKIFEQVNVINGTRYLRKLFIIWQ